MSGGAGPPIVRLTRRDFDRVFTTPTAQLHRFQLRNFLRRVLEMEDVHFHFDSAVMMPDYGECDPSVDPADSNHVSGLAVIRTAYTHAQRHEDELLLLTGHTDRSGPDNYNFDLSRRRAKNVLAVLLGKRKDWREGAEQKHKTEDIQQILIWVSATFGWPCNPGPKTNQMNTQTRAAIRAFQQRYNQEFDPANTDPARLVRMPHDDTQQPGPPIGVDGDVGPQTWGAFFDMYMIGLRQLLRTDDAGVQSLRAGVHFLDDAKKTVGCGETHPISADTLENRRSRIDRRVELLFFLPNEQPRLDCHPSETVCNAPVCEIYNPQVFTPEPIPCEDWTLLRVHLQLAWEDPSGTERNFPAGLPVIVDLADGSTINAQTSADGRLTFEMDRTKDSFTLRFESANPMYVSSATGGPTADSERLIFEPEVKGRLDQGDRVWKLPLQWSLRHADWRDASGAAAFDESAFRGLQDAARTVGRQATPLRLRLRPHWQFMRFVYFDRLLKQKRSVPRIMVDGWRDATQSNNPPDTRSNWQVATPAQGVQCLPWVIQNTVTGSGVSATATAAPMPDQNTLLRVRTAPRTFAESVPGGNITLISLQSANPSGVDTLVTNDPGINAGVVTNVNLDAPTAQRLRFYDLPPVWKSQRYFARLSGVGAPAAGDNAYEQIAAQPTTQAQPLIFSLDDVVLMHANNAGVLSLAPWNPANDRVGIFSHRFNNGAAGAAGTHPGASIEPYQPDAAGNRRYLSLQVRDLSNRNYIADYPDWTRLITRDGNLYDVFDQRTPDQPNQVVGARAAVRWIDVTQPIAGTNSFTRTPAGAFTQQADNLPIPQRVLSPRPGRTNKPFFQIQPYFDEEYDPGEAIDRPAGRVSEWQTPFVHPTQVPMPGGNSNIRDFIGRYDMVLLRCCDIVNNDTEIAVNLHYFKFFLNFTPVASQANGTAGFTPSGLPAANQPQFGDDLCRGVSDRWNGVHANNGPVELIPTDATRKLRIWVYWLVQITPQNQAHYLLEVYRPGPRAFMSAQTGFGALMHDSNPGPWAAAAGPLGAGVAAAPGAFYTMAHETGHGDSLPDEYVELWSGCSYHEASFASNLPGDVYGDDGVAMMHGNNAVRVRHLWHAAEWARIAMGNVPLRVEQGAINNYVLTQRHTQAPRRNYTYWPLDTVHNASAGARGRFDIYFFEIGPDEYARSLPVPTAAGAPAGPIRALLLVVVKMHVTFNVAANVSFSQLRTNIQAMRASVQNNFNRQWWARIRGGSFDLQPTLIIFRPRFLVATMPMPEDPALVGYLGDVGFQVPTPTPTGPAWVTFMNNNVNSGANSYANKVAAVEAFHARHFTINVRGNLAANASNWANANTLNLSRQANLQAVFFRFFGDMVGLDLTTAGNALNAARVQAQIVRRLDPNAIVQNL